MSTTVPSTGVNLHQSQLNSGRDTYINFASPFSQDAKTILREHVAFGALYDSSERFDPPRCHPDTRTAVLQTIDDWARNTSGDSKPILWLRGAAGAGKSAVAQTSAEQWGDLGILLGSFFFSRTGTGRNDSSRFVATLAYQLSLAIPSTWPHIERIVLDDMGLFKKGLRSQMKELVIRPLKAAVSDVMQARVIILIDGLDECCTAIDGRNHEAQQKEILDAILEISQTQSTPLCFLIAGRPERQMRTSFNGKDAFDLVHVIDLSSVEGSDEDIQLFVECSFDRIRVLNHLEPSWPPKEVINVLVKKSSGHFIYASTAMKYIERPRQDPELSLKAVLSAAKTQNSPDYPFAALDALYMLILETVDPASLSMVLQIFQILLFEEELKVSDSTRFSPTLLIISTYLLISRGSLYRYLVDLHSILRIPSKDDNSSNLQLIHASFGEFLTNPDCPQSFFLDRSKAHEDLLLRKIRHLMARAVSDIEVPLVWIFAVLCYGLRIQELSEAVLDGILALIGDNYQFTQHLNRIYPTHTGTVRCLESMLKMFSLPEGCGISADYYEHLRDIFFGCLSKNGIKNPEYLLTKESIEKMLATSFDSNESFGSATTRYEGPTMHTAEPQLVSTSLTGRERSRVRRKLPQKISQFLDRF